MKIGFDAKRAVQNFTGLGNYSRYVIDSLQSCYPQEEYYLYAPREKRNPQLERLIEQSNGQTTLHYPTQRCWQRLSSLWRIGGIRKELERDGIALYHGLSNELPLNIGRTQGVKSVVTIHDLIFRQLPHCYPPIDRRIYDYKARAACKQADHIIAVSECTKRDIMRYYGTPAEKISVIYQGCDPLFARRVPAEVLQEVRLRYQLPDCFLLSVGSIEERKNTLTALQALPDLPPEMHLVLVGKHTPYTDRLTDYAHRHGLSHRLHLCHGIPYNHLPAFYQLATTFIYPSVYEGFGIPILEALNSRLPVVAATGSCLEEAGGPQSIYAPPHDAAAMARAVNETLRPEVRQCMITAGIAWASRFTKEQMACQTMECYKQVLG